MVASRVAPAGMVTVTRGPSERPQAARAPANKTRNAERGSRNRRSTFPALFRVPTSAFRVLKWRIPATHPRSEEHTSELQSRVDLVCRLLLEKKNKHIAA